MRTGLRVYAVSPHLANYLKTLYLYDFTAGLFSSPNFINTGTTPRVVTTFR